MRCRMWHWRTRLGHNPEAAQCNRPEPEDHEVGQRQLQLAPLGEQTREIATSLLGLSESECTRLMNEEVLW